MRFLFLTDFHGFHPAYKEAFARALDPNEGIKHIVCAGDALPKTMRDTDPFVANQRAFLNDWLKPKLEKLKAAGITFYMMFGNDDSKSLEGWMDEMEAQGLLVRMDGRGWIPFGDYYLLGFPWVPDYPFRLKDWCAGDMEATPNPKQLGTPLGTNDTDFYDLGVPWHEEITRRPTLRDRLEALPAPPDARRAIFCMHCPPAHGGLDVCGAKGPDGQNLRVGSVAGLKHIAERQYLLSLHGHIHEAPAVSGKWWANIGDTLAVNPGASPPKAIVVDLEEWTVVHPAYGVQPITMARDSDADRDTWSRYVRGDISSGKAARLLGMGRVEFLDEASRRGISSLGYGPEELAAEVECLAKSDT